MAKFSLNMLAIALELAQHDPIYENMAIKYFEHFLYIAHAMTNMGGQGLDLWDDEDQFFYDVIHLASGDNLPLKIHSMVGLVPLFAVLAFTPGRFSHLTTLKIECAGCAQRPHLTKPGRVMDPRQGRRAPGWPSGRRPAEGRAAPHVRSG